MTDKTNNSTYKQILNVAETLFSERGYASVRLRDIASNMDMKHASLYYYVPGGKKQLFVEVMKCSFERHKSGIQEAINQTDGDIRDKLYAVSEWLVINQAMDLSRLQNGDGPPLSDAELQDLMEFAYDAIRVPIVETLQNATDLSIQDYDLSTMAFVSMMQSIHGIPLNLSLETRKKLGYQLVDMIMDGWRQR